MKPFPPGSWGLEEFADFEAWYTQLRESTDMTKTICEVFLVLHQLSLRMVEVNKPLQPDEEGTESESEDERSLHPPLFPARCSP